MTTLRLPLPAPTLLHRKPNGRCYVFAERIRESGRAPAMAEITPGAFEAIRLNPALARSDGWAWRFMDNKDVGAGWRKFWAENTKSAPAVSA